MRPAMSSPCSATRSRRTRTGRRSRSPTPSHRRPAEARHAPVHRRRSRRERPARRELLHRRPARRGPPPVRRPGVRSARDRALRAARVPEEPRPVLREDRRGGFLVLGRFRARVCRRGGRRPRLARDLRLGAHRRRHRGDPRVARHRPPGDLRRQLRDGHRAALRERPSRPRQRARPRRPGRPGPGLAGRLGGGRQGVRGHARARLRCLPRGRGLPSRPAGPEGDARAAAGPGVGRRDRDVVRRHHRARRDRDPRPAARSRARSTTRSTTRSAGRCSSTPWRRTPPATTSRSAAWCRPPATTRTRRPARSSPTTRRCAPTSRATRHGRGRVRPRRQGRGSAGRDAPIGLLLRPAVRRLGRPDPRAADPGAADGDAVPGGRPQRRRRPDHARRPRRRGSPRACPTAT